MILISGRRGDPLISFNGMADSPSCNFQLGSEFWRVLSVPFEMDCSDDVSS